ncbi:hypothetical protein SAMN02745166_03082 [Prosthecobacter debontii]|uniref:Uncharacterized protein n=1 Tax=Prosthecobacter debontii TaxID=48467 RepID=A0A1T4YEN0_9BACT|nr:hypothetical protein [Prosthecobacter debontii]SKB00163.1 hypothetical protein SAMN02745166_03082 [Prosthecobacter debontii]
MSYPSNLWHFGQSCHIGDFRSTGHLSFGLAAGFAREGLTAGQRDDEMSRTASPSVKTTSVLVGDAGIDSAQPIANLRSIKMSFGIRIPYFMKCFSLGYSEKMYEEVDGDLCVEIFDVTAFFQRFEKALNAQLPGWGALSAPAQYWDFSHVPFGAKQGDLFFLKDSSKYSSQKEYRIVLLPPEQFVVSDPKVRQSIYLGSIEDISSEKKKGA